MVKKDKFPKIPDSEFKQRVRRFKKKMSENGIDLVVAFSNLLDPLGSEVFYRCITN